MRKFIVIAFAALLSGCGFQPMYGGSPEASGILFRDVNIKEDGQSGRTGYWLEDSLRRHLTAVNAPDRTADITFTSSEERVNLGVLATDRATRADLYLTVQYKLEQRDEKGDPMKPITGTQTSVATYNIPASPYAEVSALADARRRAAEDVSDRIAREIAFRIKQ